MEHNDGGPAFPVLDHKIGYHADIRQKEAGISVRDYFAAKAMQGLLAMEANPRFGRDVEPYSQHGRDDLMAKCAYDLADAMLEARSQP